MEEWKEYKLGEVCVKIGSGATPKGGKEAYLGGDISLIRSQNVLDFTFSNEGLAYINEEQADKLMNVEVKENDVLLNITGDSVARACIVPQSVLPARVNQHVAIIRGDESLVLNKFILYLLQYKKRYLLSISQGGATRNALTKKMIDNFDISLPSLPTQQKIANILSSLDDKIEVNRRINEQLEELAQALFKSWLQKAKEKRTIGDMCNNILDYSKCSYDEVVLVNSSDVTRGIFEHHNYSPNNELKGHFKKRFRMYDVLYSEIRPRNQHYAYCLFDPDKYIASTRLMILRNKENIVSSSILYSYILLSSVQEEFTLKTETRSGTFPQGKFEDMAQITLPYHPIEQQTEMTDFLNAVYDKMWTNQQEILHLTNLRDTLLPKLMSGEMDVNERGLERT